MASNSQAAKQFVYISADFAVLVQIQNLRSMVLSFHGVIFDNKLTFVPHIRYLKEKCVKVLNLLRVVAHTSQEPTSTRCYIFIDRLFVLSSTMAALSMVSRENLTYIGSDTEPRTAAMPRCLQNLTCLKYVCSSQWTSTLHAEYTVFPQTWLIPEQSSLQYGLEPKIQSFLFFRTQSPELEKIGFKRNTVSRLSVPATPPWHPEIDFSLHSSDKAVTPPEVFKVRFY